MSRTINFERMLEAQRRLDLYTFSLKKISYEVTSEKRLLALLVELHELINETKAFKFWVLKPEGDRNRMMEEYVDVIHFILSIFSARNEKLEGIVVKDGLEKKGVDFLSDEFLGIVREYCSITEDMFKLKKEKGVNVDTHDEGIQKRLTGFAQRVIDMSGYLGFSWDEIEEAYWKKWNVNIARQDSGKY